MHYVFVINGRSDKHFISSLLVKQIADIPSFTNYEIYITKSNLDATRFVKSYQVEESNRVCFVACGGDGTINEVASGLVNSSNKLLAVMAYGTGNDFVKYYPGSNFRSVKALVEGTESKIDILKVNDRYSINVCNVGFEAKVARIANGMSRTKNSRRSIYKKAILRAFMFNRNNSLNISLDDEFVDASSFLLSSFANCRHLGGGFLCAPRAINNDGLIDFCLVSTMNIVKLLPFIEIYKQGLHLSNSSYSDKVLYRRIRSAVVSADHDFEVCLDGEIVVGSRFEISIIPSAVSLVVPAKI